MLNLLAIVGPTAVGKTALAIALAEKLNGELISADAVAVYRGLDIGSAKPDAKELARTRFHLIDVVDPAEDFSVADFARLAEEAFADIRSRGKLPILVGGTGLYVRAVTATLSMPEVAADEAFRAARWQEVEEQGSSALHAQLADIDPISAQKIHPGDAKRIIRALEVYAATGQPASAFHTPEGVHGVPKPGTLTLGLRMNREALYQAIDNRVDAMLAAGFLTEVQSLLDSRIPAEAKSLQSLGYRHLVQFLHGEVAFDETVELLKRDTRRFAKRQLSWFGGDPTVSWIDREENETMEALAHRVLIEVTRERARMGGKINE
ncbi:MAG: tRNA (adenosine(37)-N6)-dimethylallyltransferase MiaA [Armatimonas sp.]